MTAVNAAAPVLAQSLFSNSGPIVLLGAASALLAILGLLLLLPLYITHRREVIRLLAWQEREPDAGTTEFRALQAPAPGSAARPAGPMTAAERVTSERPALARIGTSERAALELEQAPLWRRALERGPRHPLVLTLLALLVAAAVFVAAALLIRSNFGDEPKGGRLDPASVEVAVVNASSSSGLAGDVADELSADDFAVSGTGVSSGGQKQTMVLYAAGQKPAGKAVARSLGLASPQPFDTEAEAVANGADVVVIVGEDRAKAADPGKG